VWGCGKEKNENYIYYLRRHTLGYMNTESNRGMISKGKTTDSSTRALWQAYQQSHLKAKQEQLAKEIVNFALRRIFHTSEGSLTYRKILRNEADGSTSPPKKVCCGF
jgi:hypothetical protein